MNVITKYSDYSIQSIEYFITEIENGLAGRDLAGLTAFTTLQGETVSRIEKINITKQHPLVSFMLTQLGEARNADLLRTGILPAISVIPGSIGEEGNTIGQSFHTESVDDSFIAILKDYSLQTQKQILKN